MLVFLAHSFLPMTKEKYASQVLLWWLREPIRHTEPGKHPEISSSGSSLATKLINKGHLIPKQTEVMSHWCTEITSVSLLTHPDRNSSLSEEAKFLSKATCLVSSGHSCYPTSVPRVPLSLLEAHTQSPLQTGALKTSWTAKQLPNARASAPHIA